MKVKAKECTAIITEFRKCLLQDRKPEDIPRLFRSVLLQVLDGRPKEETMSEWVMKSLANLRPNSAKIAPVNAESHGHRHSQSLSDIQMNTFNSAEKNTLPSELFYTESSQKVSGAGCGCPNRIEDLPV